MPDPTRVDDAGAHANGYGHLRSICFSCRSHHKRAVHPTATSPLAPVMGATSGPQCLFPTRTFGEASPLRHAQRFCDLSGSGKSVKAEGSKLGPPVAEWARHALFP